MESPSLRWTGRSASTLWTASLCASLGDAVDLVQGDEGVRVAIITGEGRAFSAGADIKERAEHPDDMEVQRSSRVLSPLCRRLERMGKLFIAAVNGLAAGGGCELALGPATCGWQPLGPPSPCPRCGWVFCRGLAAPSVFPASWGRPGPWR